MSILKRQRELKKSEKAARKRAKRHGIREPLFQEPQPTITPDDLRGAPGEQDGDQDSSDSEREDQLEN
jgi:hypothetical protein